MKTKSLALSLSLIVGVIGGVFAVGTVFGNTFPGTFSAATPAQKAAAQAHIAEFQQQHDAAVEKRISEGLPAIPTMPQSQMMRGQHPLAPPQIISSSVNYPPISGGIFICTNYFEAPTLHAQVLAGAFRSNPNQGVFLVTFSNTNQTINLPSGKGIPTLINQNGNVLNFTTSKDNSGTINFTTGTMSFTN